MNEDIRHPGAELSDAELTNVSGAGLAENVNAHKICDACKSAGASCIGQPVISLRKYLEQKGIDSIPSYQSCPFRAS